MTSSIAQPITTTNGPQNNPALGAEAHNDSLAAHDNWVKMIHWPKFTILILVPIFAFLHVPFVPLRLNTLVLSIVYYFITGIAITAGTVRVTCPY